MVNEKLHGLGRGEYGAFTEELSQITQAHVHMSQLIGEATVHVVSGFKPLSKPVCTVWLTLDQP